MIADHNNCTVNVSLKNRFHFATTIISFSFSHFLSWQFCLFGRSNCCWTCGTETNNQGNLVWSMQIPWQLSLHLCLWCVRKFPWKPKTCYWGKERERHLTIRHDGLLLQFDAEDYALYKVCFQDLQKLISLRTWAHDLYTQFCRCCYDLEHCLLKVFNSWSIYSVQ